MNYKVIDSDNYAASGVVTFKFPGGEPHVKIPDFPMGDILLFLKLRTWGDVGYAVLLMDAIYRQQEDLEPAFRNRVEAFIPYLPGARQDRSDGNSPLTKEVIASMFGYGDIPVHTFDIHSHTDISDYFKNWMPADLDLSSLRDQYAGVLAPDVGAVARAEDMAAALGLFVVGACDKVREFGTGRITHYNVPELELGRRYLVVDDICDGGATFNTLAAAVPEGVQLDLWVSHGIFSRGIDKISSRYGSIYTTDSWYHPSKFFQLDNSALEGNPRVTQFSLEPLFNKIMES